ncbi:MAG: Lon protease family protein, partial [Campylobacterota bacterium]
MPQPLEPSRLRGLQDAFVIKDSHAYEKKSFHPLHQRAFGAMERFLQLGFNDFHLYVSGSSGVGKHYNTREFLNSNLHENAKRRDLIYVNNFDDPDRPQAIFLPAGKAKAFAKEMEQSVHKAVEGLEEIFESKEYLFKKRDIDAWAQQKQEDLFFEIVKKAKKDGLLVSYDDHGYTISPMNKEGKVLSKEEYERLSDTQKEKLRNEILGYKQQIDTASSEVLGFNNRAKEDLWDLQQAFAKKVLGTIFDPLLKRYESSLPLCEFIRRVKEDLQDRVQEFMPNTQQEQTLFTLDAQGDTQEYGVNVLVDNAGSSKPPVVYEHNPTYTNLFGVVEYSSQMGALVTDFTHIKAGSLHRANGGYLILDAQKLLFAPYVWEGLKRMLQTKQCSIDTINDELGLSTAQTLRPQPVDLEIKVILIGSRQIYYTLLEYDDEFGKLFKIHADFDEDVSISRQNADAFCAMVSSIVHKKGFVPLDKDAMAQLLSQAVADSQRDRIATNAAEVCDTLTVANHLARADGAAQIQSTHVKQARSDTSHRESRIKDEIYAAIAGGDILLDLQGAVLGQVNGLSYVSVGKEAFGEPVKITALTRMGKGEVVDIQRQVDLGGSIHSKGVMTLAGYIGYKYARDSVLSMRASVSFEQSYGEVDGDSASLAELVAILSSLSGCAIDQSYGVTGSINQRGQIQPVGGINEKIEG